MSELSEADRAAIAAAMGPHWNGVFLINDIERVYLAGVAVERERCAKEAERYRWLRKQPFAAAEKENLELVFVCMIQPTYKGWWNANAPGYTKPQVDRLDAYIDAAQAHGERIRAQRSNDA